jgi:DNA polymerase III subunit beta
VLLVVEKKDLLNAVGKTQSIVERRNTMPALVNTLIEASDGGLRLFATDLEVSLTDAIPALVKTVGRAAVNAKNLFEIIKELPEGKIEIERKPNNWLRITQNRAQFNIVGVSPDEYPVFPTVGAQNFMKIDGSTLRDMIERTLYAVSTDETRYHLNGVYIEALNDRGDGRFRMVATDGHRLSLIDRKISDQKPQGTVAGVIVPRKGLHEIRKLLESAQDQTVEMAIEGVQIVIRHQSTVLMVRLIEGKYPQYQQLIPQTLKEKLLVQRDALVHSLKRVSLLSNVKSKSVTLSVSGGKMEITSNNPELGDAKEEIEVDFKGKDVRMAFNARYLQDVLTNMHEDVVQIEFNDSHLPVVIRPHQDESYTGVVMPMRI